MKNSIIGFSFKIRLHWLGNAAACAAEGLNQEQSRSNLVKIVSTEYKGEKSQKNTASILARIWCRPNEKAKGLQKRAISLVPKVESNELIGIHWAMTIAAFPFFADTVTNIGRLMSLQESITASQILLRLKQYWGDKPKVNKSLSAILSSLIDWKVLARSGSKSVYKKTSTINLSFSVGELLFAAILLNLNRNVLSYDELINHPSLFPFNINFDFSVFQKSKLFSVYPHGLDEKLIMLKDTFSD